MSLGKVVEYLRQSKFAQAEALLVQFKQSESRELAKCLILESKGNFDQAAKIAIALLEKFSVSSQTKYIKTLNILTFCYLKLGQLEIAENYNNTAMNKIYSANKLKDRWEDISLVFHLNGLIHRQLGNYDKALSSYYNALNIREFYLDEFISAKTLNNLGVIYRNLGELAVALDYFYKSSIVFEQYKASHLQAVVLLNISITKEWQGEIEDAKKYYLECFKLHEKLNNDTEKSDFLYYYTLFLLDHFSISEAISVLDELCSLDSTISKIIELRQKVCTAIYNIKLMRIKYTAKAIDILEQIISDDIIDEAITTYCIINYCDILIRELLYYRNNNIRKDINWAITKLEENVKTKPSKYNFANVLYLKTKFKIALGQINEAKKLLSQVEILTHEYKFAKLIQKLKREDLGNKINQLLSIRKDYDLHTLVDMANLQQSLSSLRKSQIVELDEKVDEKPALFLLIDQGGMTKLSIKFRQEITINDNLISSFLSAIDSFLNNTFSTSGHIQKVVHENFILAFLHRDNLIFCYAYELDNALVFDKLHRIINVLHSQSELWSVISQLSKEPEGEQLTEIKEIIQNELIRY